MHYQARRDQKIDFRHFSQFQSLSSSISTTSLTNVKDVMKAKKDATEEENSKKAVDLKTLSTKELDKMSYYDILGGIKMHSTPEQIKRAFHKACLKYHPDKENTVSSSSSHSNSTDRISEEKKSNEDEDEKNKEETLEGEKKKGEDPVFLKVKEAFETLSDKSKRRAYDSTVNFDESIPSEKSYKNETQFYQVFGACFERNLRFAAENDPDRKNAISGGSGHGSAKKKKSNRNRNKKNSGNEKAAPTASTIKFGDADASMGEVHQFYDYWVKFESWRDFTLPATELTEHDTEMAGDRYEKRWMEKEIGRKARAMKKDEMARVHRLVETAMKLDPRLKREKKRLAEEKAEMARLKKEKEQNEKKEAEEKAQREAKEEAERAGKEAKERASAKEARQQEKKILRKAKQGLRRLVLAEYEVDNNRAENDGDYTPTWNTIEDMNDDVETLCEKLSAVKLTSLTQDVAPKDDASKSNLTIVLEKANDLRDDSARAKKLAQRQRDAARYEQKRKEMAERKARMSKPWSKEELTALAKAVKKYPSGGANRWEAISLFLNNLCRQEIPRTKEECIEKFNQVASQQKKPGSSTAGAGSSTAGGDAVAEAATEEWTEEQDKLLQEGLKTYPSSMDKNERWTSIAKNVPGKKKKECVARFKSIREALKAKK